MSEELVKEEWHYRDAAGLVHLCVARPRKGTAISQLWPVCREAFPWHTDGLQSIGLTPTGEEVSCLKCLTVG